MGNDADKMVIDHEAFKKRWEKRQAWILEWQWQDDASAAVAAGGGVQEWAQALITEQIRQGRVDKAEEETPPLVETTLARDIVAELLDGDPAQAENDATNIVDEISMIHRAFLPFPPPPHESAMIVGFAFPSESTDMSPKYHSGLVEQLVWLGLEPTPTAAIDAVIPAIIASRHNVFHMGGKVATCAAQYVRSVYAQLQSTASGRFFSAPRELANAAQKAALSRGTTMPFLSTVQFFRETVEHMPLAIMDAWLADILGSWSEERLLSELVMEFTQARLLRYRLRGDKNEPSEPVASTRTAAAPKRSNKPRPISQEMIQLILSTMQQAYDEGTSFLTADHVQQRSGERYAFQSIKQAMVQMKKRGLLSTLDGRNGYRLADPQSRP